MGFYPIFEDTPPTQLTLQKISVQVALKAKELALSFKPIIHLHIRLLTASHSGDTELLTQGSNLLAIQVTRHKFELFVHLRTFIPRHRVVPPMPKTVKYVSGIKC